LDILQKQQAHHRSLAFKAEDLL